MTRTTPALVAWNVRIGGSDETLGAWARSALPAGGYRSAWVDDAGCLAIRGSQPFIAGQVTVAGVLALQNRAELAAELSLPEAGHSDAGIVAAAYNRWGEDAFSRLYGDFALGLRDRDTGRTYLVRDHAGLVPLYVARTPWGVAAASDLGTLVTVPAVDTALDDARVVAAVAERVPPGTRALPFRHIFRLPPGTWMRIEADGEIVEREYWRPEACDFDLSMTEEEAIDGLEQRIAAAVRRRLPADGVIGAHLTGGLDSSMIVALAARYLGAEDRPVPLAFCWQEAPGPEPDAASEHRLIAAIAEAAQVEPIFGRLGVDEFLEDYCLDFPRHVPPADLLHERGVIRAAEARGVSVMLSGWGGDEVATHNGRGLNFWLLRNGMFGRLVAHGRHGGPGVARTMVSALRRLFPRTNPRRSRADDVARLVARPFRNRLPRFRDGDAALTDAARARAALLRNGHVQARIEAWAAAAAEHGLEYRYPMLDRALVEFALTIPPFHLRRGNVNRWAARKVAERMVPDEIAWNRSKDEPARTDGIFEHQHAALQRIADWLRTHPSPAGSQYIDIPALIARIGTYDHVANRHATGVRGAIRALDLTGVLQDAGGRPPASGR